MAHNQLGYTKKQKKTQCAKSNLISCIESPLPLVYSTWQYQHSSFSCTCTQPAITAAPTPAKGPLAWTSPATKHWQSALYQGHYLPRRVLRALSLVIRESAAFNWCTVYSMWQYQHSTFSCIHLRTASDHCSADPSQRATSMDQPCHEALAECAVPGALPAGSGSAGTWPHAARVRCLWCGGAPKDD